MNRYVLEFKVGITCVVYASNFALRDSVCGYPIKYLAFKNNDNIVAEFNAANVYCVRVSHLFSGSEKVWG